MFTRIDLHEKYRPRSLSDVLAQPKVVATLNGRVARFGTLAGRAYWISGSSGTGKTSLARIIAESVADPLCIQEYKTGREVTADEARSIGYALESYGWGATAKNGRAIIINEAHHMGGAAIDIMLGLLEPVPSHAVVIFTTTRAGQEALFGDSVEEGPILSRCTQLALTTQGLAAAFAARAQTIAKVEGLDGGRDLKAFVRLAQDCKNNMRDILQRLDDGCFADMAVAA